MTLLSETASARHPEMVENADARRHWAGCLFMVGATLMWSLSGVFAKSPLFADWAPEDRGLNFAFWRSLFAGLWLLPAIRRPRLSGRLVPLLIGFLVMTVTFLQSMSLTTAANAVWLQAMAPLWIFLFGAFVSRDSLERRDLITLAWGLGGLSMILGFELSHGIGTTASLVGVSYGLASGVFYGLVVVAMRGLRNENPAWLISLSLLTTATVLGPYVLWRCGLPSAEQLAVLSLFGLLQMGLPYLLLAQALRRIGSQEAAGIGLIEPAIAPLWVYLTWGEMPAWWTLAGGALILVGLILRYRRNSPQGEPALAMTDGTR